MTRTWTVYPCNTERIVPADDWHWQAIATAERMARFREGMPAETSGARRVRQAMGTMLMRAGQRLHGSVVRSTDGLPAAGR